MVMKVHNWDSKLVEFAAAHRGMAFEWGKTDCVTLSHRALKVCCDIDPWADLPLRYRSAKGALKAFRGLDVEDVFRSTGGVEVGYHFGTAGDIALGPSLDAHGLPALSILIPGRKVLLSTGEHGVVIIDKLALAEGTRFYRYG